MTDRLRDLSVLAVRLAVGGAGIAHGTQKLFGWFGGGGLDATTQAMTAMGFEPSRRNALLAGATEAGGGALLALGLATGSGASALVGAMTTAVSVHKDNGFFATSGGYELPLTYGVIAAALGLAGPGRYSLDELTGDVLNRPWMRIVPLVLALGSASYVISLRRKLIADRLAGESADHQQSDAGS